MERALGDDGQVADVVDRIVAQVRQGGDMALRELSQQIDKVELDALRVSEDEFAEAQGLVAEEVKQAILVAEKNIRAFHAAQKPAGVDMETVPGVRCELKSVPIRRVGLYVPGGSAPLFSTVLMLAIPASVAGCERVVLCTPVQKNGKVAPEVLFAAQLCGVAEVYKVGGAQAVAAMAYGTPTIPKVDKIFGPGNRYVTCAKTMLSNVVAIDMPAGPSEVMVIADGTARAEFAAADMLSQAEHGADSQAVLVAYDKGFAQQVERQVQIQLERLPRKETALKALENSYAVVFDNEKDAVDFALEYAPEHLIVSTKNAREIASKVITAGSTFIGNYTPESAGDYASGTNHTLPTAGWGRSFSGVSTMSFMRTMTIQEATPEGLAALAGVITAMARAEGLEAHAMAVDVRVKEEK